ncbi:MAG: TIGR02757 family protein [Deltaproteobacteria bacterium]|nr:TIGR02757 family protein [Deltaproteobacteria bacterium]
MNSTYSACKESLIKEVLEETLLKMRKQIRERVQNDPIFFPKLYRNKNDIEIAGFISAQFAYGNIRQIKRFLSVLFCEMGDSPYEFIREWNGRGLSRLYYRFQKEEEIKGLFHVLKEILVRHGSLGTLFSNLYNGDIRKAIFSIRDHLNINQRHLIFFFPFESSSNPLKRWNLFLRWMTRKDDIDFGIWEFIKPSELIVPLDTHIFRISGCLGWTFRKTRDKKAALEITEKLKILSPEDPLKYDFLLCHFVGIDNKCSGIKTEICKEKCILWIASI